MPSLRKKVSKRRKKTALRAIEQSEDREARSFQPLPERDVESEQETLFSDYSDSPAVNEEISGVSAVVLDQLESLETNENDEGCGEEFLSLETLDISHDTEGNQRSSRHQSHSTRKQNEERNYQEYRKRALETYTQASCQQLVSDRYKAMADFFRQSTRRLVQVISKAIPGMSLIRTGTLSQDLQKTLTRLRWL